MPAKDEFIELPNRDYWCPLCPSVQSVEHLARHLSSAGHRRKARQFLAGTLQPQPPTDITKYRKVRNRSPQPGESVPAPVAQELLQGWLQVHASPTLRDHIQVGQRNWEDAGLPQPAGNEDVGGPGGEDPCQSPGQPLPDVPDQQPATGYNSMHLEVPVSDEGMYDDAFNPPAPVPEDLPGHDPDGARESASPGDTEDPSSLGALAQEIAAEFADLRLRQESDEDSEGDWQDVAGILLSAREIAEQMDWRPRGGDSDDVVDEQLRYAIGLAGGAYFGADVAQHVWAELKDQMTQDMASQLDDSNTPPRPHTVRWYQEHGDDPVSHCSTITVRQTCQFIARHKLTSKSTVRGVDLLCGFLHRAGILPAINLIPRCATHAGVTSPAHIWKCPMRQSCHRHHDSYTAYAGLITLSAESSICRRQTCMLTICAPTAGVPTCTVSVGHLGRPTGLGASGARSAVPIVTGGEGRAHCQVEGWSPPLKWQCQFHVVYPARCTRAHQCVIVLQCIHTWTQECGTPPVRRSHVCQVCWHATAGHDRCTPLPRC